MAKRVAEIPSDIDAQLLKAAEYAVTATLDRLRRNPTITPEWLSLQSAAAYLGISEAHLVLLVRQGSAPKSIKWSRCARRFKREWLDQWAIDGGQSAAREQEAAE
jgi:predicted DNA-binding transcriptional regulator AlpA